MWRMIVTLVQFGRGIVLHPGVIDPLCRQSEGPAGTPWLRALNAGMTNHVPLDHLEPTDDRLIAALDGVLATHFGRRREIVSLVRELAPYRSSTYLEELVLELDAGTRLELVFKDPGRQAGNARQVKPDFVLDPQREIETYRTVLRHERLGTPTFYGAAIDPLRDQYWFFLERIPGTRLKELGEFGTWLSAARWVAGLHAEYGPQVEELKTKSHLLNYDRTYLEQWIGRARHVSGGTAATARQIETLAQCYDTLIERLAALPVTLIHGEFYPSNILVRDTVAGASVSPVDWEMAAVGPALLDLAAFTSGGWSPAKALALSRAYYEAAAPAFKLSSFDEFMTALDACRLFLAVQWLGWSTDWQPPPEHDFDWLTAALRLARRLGLVPTKRVTRPTASAAAKAPGQTRSAPRPARAQTPRAPRSRR